jgi:hypothetical protein
MSYTVTAEEKPCPSSVAGIVDPYIDELDKANKKIDQLYHFIEMTEALTYDQATSKRIRSFLQEEGIWEKQQ